MAQVVALGVKWPQPPGWRQELVGKQIDDTTAVRFETGKHVLSAKTMKQRRKHQVAALVAAGLEVPTSMLGLTPPTNPKSIRRAEKKAQRKAKKTLRETFVQTLKRPPPNKVTIYRPPPAPKRQSPVFEMTDLFLNSFEWRRVRMVALKKYGAVCQCCGATPQTGAVMNVDHIKPRKLYPSLALDVENLQILCHECNHGKGNWDMTDWRANDATA